MSDDRLAVKNLFARDACMHNKGRERGGFALAFCKSSIDNITSYGRVHWVVVDLPNDFKQAQFQSIVALHPHR